MTFWVCFKFCGSCAVVGLVGLVPWCLPAFVGIFWVQKFLWWVFRRSKVFCHGYFVGRNFLMGICWVRIFFLWVLRWSNFFSGGLFRELKIFICWLHEEEWYKQKNRNSFQTTFSFLNQSKIVKFAERIC